MAKNLPAQHIQDELKVEINRRYPKFSHMLPRITFHNEYRATVTFNSEKSPVPVQAIFEYTQKGKDDYWRCSSDWND